MPEPNTKSVAASVAAHASWAKVDDRTARTAKARAGLQQRFLDEAGGDPAKAKNLKRAHFQRLALKSAQARRARAKANQLDREVRSRTDELLDALADDIMAVVESAPPLTDDQRQRLAGLLRGGAS